MIADDGIEPCIPSVMGFEKVATENAVPIAEKMGFPEHRIEGSKSEIRKASLNAIEKRPTL